MYIEGFQKSYGYNGNIGQGQLQEWTEHSTLIFENLKPVEISKNCFSYLYSKTKMGVADVIFEPRPPNFENHYNL